MNEAKGNEERAGRFIILTYAGWWTLHYESFRTRESADREAADISTKTLVLDVEEVANKFLERGKFMHSELSEDVEDFMHAVGHTVREIPQTPSDDEVRLRVRLVLEEAFEFAMACAGGEGLSIMKSLRALAMMSAADMDVCVNMVEAADALADTDYVVEGARLNFGINGHPIAAEVHRSNMSKIKNGKNDEHGKFIKPDDWTPPDIEGCLSKQGWTK